MNPITWSLSLLRGAAVSAFGAGFFDDAGDIPGQPVLLFTLRGTWAPDTGVVRLTKAYPDAPGVTVSYEGRLRRAPDDGAWQLTGTWRNEFEGTHGQFACRREEEQGSAGAGGAAA